MSQIQLLHFFHSFFHIDLLFSDSIFSLTLTLHPWPVLMYALSTRQMTIWTSLIEASEKPTISCSSTWGRWWWEGGLGFLQLAASLCLWQQLFRHWPPCLWFMGSNYGIGSRGPEHQRATQLPILQTWLGLSPIHHWKTNNYWNLPDEALRLVCLEMLLIRPNWGFGSWWNPDMPKDDMMPRGGWLIFNPAASVHRGRTGRGRRPTPRCSLTKPKQQRRSHLMPATKHLEPSFIACYLYKRCISCQFLCSSDLSWFLCLVEIIEGKILRNTIVWAQVFVHSHQSLIAWRRRQRQFPCFCQCL